MMNQLASRDALRFSLSSCGQVTSIDILRASARVPRDTVRFYEGLNAAGLQVRVV